MPGRARVTPARLRPPAGGPGRGAPVLSYASDECGNVTSRTVEGPASPPRIIAQPVDRLIALGDFTSFAVIAANASGATFQWTFDGAPIPDATSDSLPLTGVGPANV